MTKEKAFSVLAEMLHELAPEVDLDETDKDATMSEELDLDSFSFLNLVEMIHARLGLDIPEADYAAMASVNACIDYLAEHAP